MNSAVRANVSAQPVVAQMELAPAGCETGTTLDVEKKSWYFSEGRLNN